MSKGRNAIALCLAVSCLCCAQRTSVFPSVGRIRESQTVTTAGRSYVTPLVYDFTGSFVSGGTGIIYTDSSLGLSQDRLTVFQVDMAYFLDIQPEDFREYNCEGISLSLSGLSQSSYTVFDGYSNLQIGQSSPVGGYLDIALDQFTQDGSYLYVGISATGDMSSPEYVYGSDISMKWESHAMTPVTNDVSTISLPAFTVRIPSDYQDEFPAVLCLHGGDWQSDINEDIGYTSVRARDYYNYMTDDLMANGYVQIEMSYTSADYYSSTTVPYYRQAMLDIEHVLEYVFVPSHHCHVDTDSSIGIIGYSAGAHLGLLYAYGVRYDGTTVGHDPLHVGVVISEGGPTDFTDMGPYYDLALAKQNQSNIYRMLQGTFRADFSSQFDLVGTVSGYSVSLDTWESNNYQEIPQWACCSPKSYVTSSASLPFTVLSYSENDDVVPKTYGNSLKNRLSYCNQAYADLDVSSYVPDHQHYSSVPFSMYLPYLNSYVV